MKNLLNFGVSDPLTLGMTHPVADRLETLGRARPTTWRSRLLALSAMSVLVLGTAPLSIAADDQPVGVKAKSVYKFLSTEADGINQTYEIVTENGEKKAYQVLADGSRVSAILEAGMEDGYILTKADGQTIELPNVDVSRLGSLSGYKDLESGFDFEAFEQLQALSEISGLKLNRTGEISFEFDDEASLDNGGRGILEEMPEHVRNEIQNMIASKGGKFKIVASKNADGSFGFSSENGEKFILPDAIVDMKVAVVETNGSLASVQHQLEMTKRQLELLSNNENLSFDLQNALRDLESAQKSIEEAESRLLDETE